MNDARHDRGGGIKSSAPIPFNRPRRTEEIYLVMVRVKPPTPDAPNTEVVTAKLRWRDADHASKQIPGSWIEKVVATKP